MRKGSRVNVTKEGSGFDGMVGTIRLVDRGPTGKIANAAGIEYKLWYLVELDHYKSVTVDDDSFLFTDDEQGCVWFRETEVLPVLRETARH